jgi:WD40 repeat protein
MATEPARVSFTHRVSNIAVSSSGQLVAASGDRQLTVCELATGETLMHVMANGAYVQNETLLAFSADDSHLIEAHREEINVWDISTGAQLSSVVFPSELTHRTFAIGPDDTIIADTPHGICRFDLDGNEIARLRLVNDCSTCRISHDGRQLAWIQNGWAVAANPNTGSDFSLFTDGDASCMAFSPDGRTIAVGDNEGRVSLFDTQTGQLQWTASPPGRYRWPWAVPVLCLLLWIYAARRIGKRRTTARPNGFEPSERTSLKAWTLTMSPWNSQAQRFSRGT